MDWEEAKASAQQALAGTKRIRLPGAPEGAEAVELAALDWGGDGPLIVMHHANGFCAGSLGEVGVQLSQAGFRVISFDARGHGDSTPVVPGAEPNPYAWDTLAADCSAATEAILEYTGRDRIELAIGHSFGGALMLAAASAAPSHFGRLLLCDPVIFPPLTAAERAAAAKGNKLVEATLRRRDHFGSRVEAFTHCGSRGLFKNFTPTALALYVLEGMRPTGAGAGAGADAAVGEVTLKCAREVEAAIFGGGGTLDLTGQVDDFAPEVRIVHALQGNFSRAVYDRLVEPMQAARVESLEAGHLFPMEEPVLVLDRVLEMMGRG
ncbi:MAG: alpha/beta fold hydrolase [Myxococcota bacterium]